MGIAYYTPRTSLAELQEAFKMRWVHGLNTQAPWSFVKAVVSSAYSRFLPVPWFIGAAMFQFQTTYWKGGAEMNFGLFGLGEEQIGETGEVCENGCRSWPVHCLTTKLSWLPGSKANRAQAVATAWGGSI